MSLMEPPRQDGPSHQQGGSPVPPLMLAKDPVNMSSTNSSNEEDVEVASRFASLTAIDMRSPRDPTRDDSGSSGDSDEEQPPAEPFTSALRQGSSSSSSLSPNGFRYPDVSPPQKGPPSADASADSDADSDTDTQERARMISRAEPLPPRFILAALLGIRTAVLNAVSNLPSQLSPDDFVMSRAFRLSMAGDNKCTVKDFAPSVFCHIRSACGVSTESYLASWSNPGPPPASSAGRSGAMMVFSPDRKYIIKTLTHSEKKRFCKVLPGYFNHISTNPNSLLTRIYGLHRVEKDMYFAVMGNLFATALHIDETYDLKGSSVGRETPAAMKTKPNTVLKDLDFNRTIHLAYEDKIKLVEQIDRDAQFLADNHLMDYSLLVGVHKCDTPPLQMERKVRRDSLKKIPSMVFFVEQSKTRSSTLTRSRRKSMDTMLASPQLLPTSLPHIASLPVIDSSREAIEPASPSSAHPIPPSPSSSSGSSFNLTTPPMSPSILASHTPSSPIASSAPAFNTPPPHMPSPILSHSSNELARPASDSHVSSAHPRPLALATPSSPQLSRILSDQLPTPREGVPFYRRDNGGMLSKPIDPRVSVSAFTLLPTTNGIPSSPSPSLSLDAPLATIPDDAPLPDTLPPRDANTPSPSHSDIHYEIYYFGVIDFLQKYNSKKKIAGFAKSFKHEKKELSTVDPVFYMRRFMQMVQRTIG
eukprot:TRINITY_DN8710_c1_g1_i1.p1 TRINITY_DN8710_c1_g1~~TRINITY_DN8710_c1_g1_i1.p1  ORF type:complete len:701 (-),score=185.25 TRINITY_DN8710_c1_g1_i1:44-2146(-)